MDFSLNTTAIILLVVSLVSLLLWAREKVGAEDLKQKLGKADDAIERKETALGYLKLRHKQLEGEYKDSEEAVNKLENEREQLLQAIEHQKGTNTPEAMVKALKTAFDEM